MPFASNDGVRVHYETEGSGEPLVLQHGSGGDGNAWREYGYVAALKDGYRCILMDARGHGESDKPHDRDSYHLGLRVSDIVAVLDSLGIEKASYFGYSMGGWIGLGAAKYAPSRFKSFVIGASHPYFRSFEAARTSYRKGGDAMVATAEAAGLKVTPEAKARMMKNDFAALLAAHGDRLDMSEVLPTMTMPSLFIVGDADPLFEKAKYAATFAPGAKFVALPGLDHGGAFQASDRMLPHVRAFLEGVRGR
jgi:pimeloyl-ACP methyl ester carboxylesterase